MASARVSSLAVVVVLLGLVYVGSQLLAQQPAPSQVLTPESLRIPEQPRPAPPSASDTELSARYGRASEASGERRMADGAAHVRRLGIQPARSNQHEERRAPPAGMDAVDRHEQRARGCAARQWRRDVRLDVVQPGARARREVGRLRSGGIAARADQRARQTGEPRRRALWRQGVLPSWAEAALVALDAKTGKRSLADDPSATTRPASTSPRHRWSPTASLSRAFLEATARIADSWRPTIPRRAASSGKPI